MSVKPAEFRKALGCFATGITVITLDYEGEVQGMTANAFTSVSLDPMLVLVCVDRRARTHAHLHAKKRFGVNVLAKTSGPFRSITRAPRVPTIARPRKPAPLSSALSTAPRCCAAPWPTWNAVYILHRRRGITPSSSPRWKRSCSAKASPCSTFRASIGGSGRRWTRSLQNLPTPARTPECRRLLPAAASRGPSLHPAWFALAFSARSSGSRTSCSIPT